MTERSQIRERAIRWSAASVSIQSAKFEMESLSAGQNIQPRKTLLGRRFARKPLKK
jgi:hypothetical protein